MSYEQQLEAHDDVSRSDVAPADIPLFQRYSSVNTTAASTTKDNMIKTSNRLDIVFCSSTFLV